MDNRRYTDGIHPPYPHWNDIEHASSVPWDYDCCHPEKDDCVCVTSGDVQRWNTVSGISAISSMTPAIQELIDLDLPTSSMTWNDNNRLLTETSGLWNGASAVSGIPEIMDKLYSVSAEVDALKTSGMPFAAYTEGDIIGSGISKDDPIRLKNRVVEVVDLIQDIIATGSPIATGEDLKKLKDDINDLNRKYTYETSRINELDKVVQELIKMVKDIPDFRNYLVNSAVSVQESKKHPKLFFYWDSALGK